MISDNKKQIFEQAVSDILPDINIQNQIMNIFNDITKNCADIPCNFGDIMYIIEQPSTRKINITEAKVTKITINEHNSTLIYGATQDNTYRTIAWNDASIGVYAFFNKKDAENKRNSMLKQHKKQ